MMAGLGSFEKKLRKTSFSPWYCKIFDDQGVLYLRLGPSNIIGKTPRSTISIEYFVAVEIHNIDSLICRRLRFEIFRNESKHECFE